MGFTQTETQYVYVFVRRDLPGPQQVVQSCHASIETAKSFPKDCCPHLVVCSIKNELRLRQCLIHLQRLGIKHEPFFEPDLNNALTAIATEPITGVIREQLRHYQCLKLSDLNQKEKNHVLPNSDSSDIPITMGLSPMQL